MTQVLVLPPHYYFYIQFAVSIILEMNIRNKFYMNNHVYSTLFKTQERESDI